MQATKEAVLATTSRNRKVRHLAPPALVALAAVLLVGSSEAAALVVGATSCSVDYRASSHNLDCRVAVPGGAATLDGQLAIVEHAVPGEHLVMLIDHDRPRGADAPERGRNHLDVARRMAAPIRRIGETGDDGRFVVCGAGLDRPLRVRGVKNGLTGEAQVDHWIDEIAILTIVLKSASAP